jgi:ParB family chromosome partitioning protein
MPKETVKKKTGPGSAGRKKMALGKGLGALIPDIEAGEDRPGDYFFCDIDLIRPNRFQPRQRFADEELGELSDSIKEQGILQPLLVRKDENGYELIAGERRIRAAKLAGLAQVPVVIKKISDSQLLEMSIVENIQRENFNPIEEAEAYHRLIAEFNLTQDQAANRVGKSRSAVANFLRLRQLPDPIKESIREGSLSMGHARALLGITAADQQLTAWRAVVAKNLSVRQTEALIRRLKSEKKRPKVTAATSEDRYFSDMAEDLSRYFGTKVLIRKSGQRGKVEIEFYSNDDLDRLIGLLKSR